MREAFQLLTLASARDGRTVDVELATVWADDLSGVSLQDAVLAARAHYRQSDKWLMPVHILAEVKRNRPAITVQPGSVCAGGRHKRLVDGTCLLCDDRIPGVSDGP